MCSCNVLGDFSKNAAPDLTTPTNAISAFAYCRRASELRAPGSEEARRVRHRRPLNGNACSHRPRTWLRSWKLKPVAVRTRPAPGISVCPVANRDCSAPHFARARVAVVFRNQGMTYRNLLISTKPDLRYMREKQRDRAMAQGY